MECLVSLVPSATGAAIGTPAAPVPPHVLIETDKRCRGSLTTIKRHRDAGAALEMVGCSAAWKVPLSRRPLCL